MAGSSNWGAGMVIGGMAQQDLGNWTNALLQGREARKTINKARDTYNQYYDQAMQYYTPYTANAGEDYAAFRRGVRGGQYDSPVYNFNYNEQQPGAYNAPQYQETPEKPFDFQGDPGYQWRLQQGANAVDQSAAARGTQLSGATLKALQRYGQNFGSNEYQNAYARNRQAYLDKRDFGYNRYLNDRSFGAGQNQEQYNRWAANRGFAQENYGNQFNSLAANRANQYNQMSNLANIGYGANQTMAQNTLGHGQTLADYEMAQGGAMMGQIAALNQANSQMGQHFQEIGGSGTMGGMSSLGKGDQQQQQQPTQQYQYNYPGYQQYQYNMTRGGVNGGGR